MKRCLCLALFLLFILLSATARAVVVEDLYTVELPVEDQSTSLRLKVFNLAFRDVIIKVSGTSETIEHPALGQPLRSSSRYVHQFRYLTRKTKQENSFDAGQLFLRVVFNQEAIENLLRENGIPVWGKERPSTLFLFNYERNQSASIVSGDTTPGVVEAIEVLARERGIPVLFPLLDLEDRVHFGIQDINAFNEQKMTLAAARYAPDALLVGRITQRTEGWLGQWQAYFSNQVFKWSFKGDTDIEVFRQAIARLGQTLAKEYALATFAATDEELLLAVDQMKGLTDHIRVQAYLQSLDAIEAARLVLVEQDKVTYRVNLRNSSEDLSRLIGLSDVLEQLELPQIDATTENREIIMNYRLIH